MDRNNRNDNEVTERVRECLGTMRDLVDQHGVEAIQQSLESILQENTEEDQPQLEALRALVPVSEGEEEGEEDDEEEDEEEEGEEEEQNHNGSCDDSTTMSTTTATANNATAPVPRSFHREELACLDLLKHPVWIYDQDNKTCWWANKAAVQIWNADSLEDLQTRDFADIMMSQATEQRLQSFYKTITQGKTESDQFTGYSRGKPCTLNLTVSAIHVEPDGRILMFKEADLPRPKEELDHKSLRWIEILRHLPLAVMQFDRFGNVMEQNPEASTVFGGTDSIGPTFVERFVERTQGNIFFLKIMSSTGGEYCYQDARMYTGDGEIGWYSLKAYQKNDPVTSEIVIHLTVMAQSHLHNCLMDEVSLSTMDADLFSTVEDSNQPTQKRLFSER